MRAGTAGGIRRAQRTGQTRAISPAYASPAHPSRAERSLPLEPQQLPNLAGPLGGPTTLHPQLNAGRELDFDLGLVVDAHDALSGTAGEHVPAA